MMKNKIREEFEKWLKLELDDMYNISVLEKTNNGMNYRDCHTDIAWLAWKASREQRD
ncbi:MAG: hypothetical protein ACL7BU_13830 [Candidatus Phlomobacter fragariae]